MTFLGDSVFMPPDSTGMAWRSCRYS